MSQLGNTDLGIGNVDTAGQAKAGGAGTITQITSVDASVVVTNPNGPVTDLSAPGAAPGGAPPAVAAAGAAGTNATFSRSNHTHAGVTSVQALQGVVALVGPSALGSGAGGNASAPAYRSDLPLATTWFIDPVNGSDAATNAGTTSATALKTLHGAGGLKQRWWGAHIATATTVTILGNIPSTDAGAWNFSVAPGILVTFLGNLGATTGFGGAPIDNTLFTGSVTGFAAASLTPSADDIELTDASIPVSFTASGLLASGVIFRRTVTATRHWYSLKDLGAKTIRITSPMNSSGFSAYQSLTVGDAYSAFALCQIPSQAFGAAAGQVMFDSLSDIGTASEFRTLPFAPRRRRVWLGNALTDRQINVEATNCMWEVTTLFLTTLGGAAALNGGGIRGNGTTLVTAFTDLVVTSCLVSQGASFGTNDRSYISIETMIAIHDCGVPLLKAFANGRISFMIPQGNAGLSGKGNTARFAAVSTDSELTYGFGGAAPPFSAASTTDPTVSIEGHTSLTVAQLPTAQNSIIRAQSVPAGGPVNIVGKFSCVINTNAGGATSTWMGDGGLVNTNSGAGAAIEYPTSMRLITRLRVCAVIGMGADPIAVTLQQRPNGGALADTAMTVTIPAGAAVGATFVDLAHPILFGDGDTFALIVRAPATGEGNQPLTAVLEGP